MAKYLRLAQNIRSHLEIKKLTYRNLSQRVKCTPSSLFAWGNGAPITLNEKNLDVIERIRIELGLPDIASLLFGGPPKENLLTELGLVLHALIQEQIKKEKDYDH